jgi:hypothetical protein
MFNRRRRSLFALLALAVALGTMPSAGALYGSHNGVVSADPADNTPHVVDGKVTTILPMGSRIYVGGTFTKITQTKQDAAAGTNLILRPGLFAFDAATGAIDHGFNQVPAWGVDPGNPAADIDGRGVEALAPGPNGTLFVGGAFSYTSPISGQGRKLMKLNGVTGAEDPGFAVSTGAYPVKDLAVHGARLFLAGPFSKVQGADHKGLAVVDVDNGALDTSFNVQFTVPRQHGSEIDPVTGLPIEKPRVETIALTPDGKTLVAGGNFTKADGQDRFQIALIDVTPGSSASVKSWQTSRFDDRRAGAPSTWPKDDQTGEPDPFHCAEKFDTHMRDMDVSPDGKYVVVVTTGGFSRGTMCDTASRWEISAQGAGLQPTWVDYDGGDSFTGVAATGAVVYVGGHMRAMNNNYTDGSSTDAIPGPGHVAREGIAALDPASGLPLPWNPGRDRGQGAWALVSTPEGLWVGSDTNDIGGEKHHKLSFFPLAGGSVVPTWSPQALPADLYRLGADKTISRRVFGGSTVGSVVPLPSSVDWSQMRGAFALPGRIYTGRSDGKLLRWSFDGSRLGTPEEVSLRGMEADLGRYFPITRMTGMFYDNGRLYFTVQGDKKLYYRYFLPEATVANDVVGAEIVTASGETDGRDWSKVTGMTMADGKIYWAENGAELYQASFNGGKPGSKSVAIANAGVAGRGLFLLPATSTPPPVSIDPPAPPAPPAPPGPPPGTQPGGVRRSGYWMVGSDGAVYAFGDAHHLGNAPLSGGAQAVDLEPTPSYNGYWIVDDAGHVFTYGDARPLGNADASKLVPGEKVTSLSATPTGNGYWFFTSRGRVLPMGDAVHAGDVSAIKLNGPVLDSIATPSGRGYYMVGSDGGIFTFGDAVFRGSTGNIKLNAPVQSLVPDPDGVGYWLVASDGGVFSFDGTFRGSMGGKPLNKPMTGMVPYGNGYLMVGEDGGIFNFSDKAFAGSLGATPPARPIVSVASVDE